MAAASVSVVPVSTSSVPVRPCTRPMVTSQNGSRQRCALPVSRSHAKYTERKVAPSEGGRKYDSLMRASLKLGPAVAAVIAAFIAATTCALLPCTSAALPPATQVVNVVAVAANGQPSNGYRLLSSSGDPGNIPEVSDCEGSPAAVSNDLYSCSPSAAAADVCWPSTSGTL